MADEKDKSAQKAEGDTATNPKTGTSKKASPRKKASTKKTAPTADSGELKALKAELEQRDEAHQAQFNELMQGLEKTFGHIHKSSSEQTQKLSSVMIGLEKAFNNIHTGTQSRDKNSSNSIDQVSQTIIRSSEEMRKEYEEMERLHLQQLEAEKERHEYSFNVLKVIAVPAMILAVLGIGYMFYTVTVMERAMTAMSADMNAMRGSMGEMTSSVGSMNNNVENMSQNMQGMRRDMGVLTHNVAPAMDGMRQMMPWAPY